MKLILHIGTEKTGTTSIQKFLMINRELLNSNNILIPKTISLPNGNHRWAPTFAFDDDYEDDFTLWKFEKNKDLRKKLIDEKLKEFKKEISMSNANICIISSEHFSSRLTNIENIKKLKKLLSSLFDEISIVLYIRQPIEAAISLLSTAIKSGCVRKDLDLNKFSNSFNNLKIIKTWETIFSKKNFKIKLFDKVEFVNNDLIQDFCCECNIKITSRFTIPEMKNKTLTLDQMKYLNYLNQYFPKFINGKVNTKRGKLTEFIIKNFKSSNYFLPTKKDYQLFQEHFADNDDFIKREYFPHKKQLWSTYKKGFALKENIIIDFSEREIEFLDVIRELWSGEIKFLHAIRKLWSGEKKFKVSVLRIFFNKIKMLLGRNLKYFK